MAQGSIHDFLKRSAPRGRVRSCAKPPRREKPSHKWGRKTTNKLQRLSCGWRGSWFMVLGGDLSEAGHQPCSSGLPCVSRRSRRRRRSACSPPCSAPPCHEDCGEAMQTIVTKTPPFGAWRFSRTPYRLRPNTPETVRQCRQKRCRPMVSPRKV